MAVSGDRQQPATSYPWSLLRFRPEKQPWLWPTSPRADRGNQGYLHSKYFSLGQGIDLRRAHEERLTLDISGREDQ